MIFRCFVPVKLQFLNNTPGTMLETSPEPYWRYVRNHIGESETVLGIYPGPYWPC